MNPSRHSPPRNLWPSLAAISTSLILASGVWAQGGDEDIIELSPFQVTSSSNDIGYYAENTLAGSRLNTNVSDLASSISVVTRQQMDDTASLDINDIFRYEINTEGSATYTPAVQSMRGDGVADTNAGFTVGSGGNAQTNATSNRVRGLGAPTTSTNYYPSIAQVPFDAYNVQSIEINRGPNSMLFGMGSPAGIVNQSTAQAQLNHEATTLQFRVDDRGSHRASFSANRSLLDDKLAVYAALLYDEKKFERKPSYDITRRQYAAVTYKPFSKTTIRANFENYLNDNRRPNSLTPRDFVTEWRNAGQPVYDPRTLTIKKMATGEEIGPYIMNGTSPYINQTQDYIKSLPDYDPSLWANADELNYNGVNIFGEAALTNPNSVLFVPGIAFANSGRPTMQIANGQLQNWFAATPGRYRTQYGTATNPAANADLYPPEADILANPASNWIYNQRWTASAAWSQINSDIGSYKYPGVTDRSIYDWTSVNINQMNFGQEENRNYNVELEQEILPDLHLSAGWFRQDFESVSNYTVAQLNVTTLFVDTNMYLPDGRENPYFGQTYVEDFDPDQFVNQEEHDHYRAMLAYTPDFTRNDGWTRWLGRHQVVGLYSFQDSDIRFRRNRWFFTGGDEAANGTIRWLKNPNNNADGTPTGWNYQNTSARRTFYLSEPGDPMGTVTRGSGEFSHSRFTGDVMTYNFDRNAWEPVSMTQEFVTHEANTVRSQRELEAYSAGITSHLWSDRLVTTLGIRKDNYKARSTSAGVRTLDDGTTAPAMTNQEKWVDGVLQTDDIYSRFNKWDEEDGTTSTIGAVLRPFSNRQSIEARANGGNLFWEFVRDFGISYNKSDNFNAPDSAQVDLFGNTLPKPTGEGEDIGIQFSLFDRKLFARVTYFEATNENERIGGGAAVSRLWDNFDTTIFRTWASTIALINMGFDPEAEGFGADLTPAQEDTLEAATAEIWGQPYDYYQSLPGSIAATRNAEAQGIEAQIVYNPVPNWTMKFTFGQQETKYSDVLTEFDEWYAHRLPVWDSARAADHLLPQYADKATYTTYGGRPVDLTNFWSSYGYQSNVAHDNQFGSYNPSLYYDINVTPQVTLARDLEGQAAPGQRKYRWSFITNYLFTEGPMDGISLGGGLRWEDEAIIGYYGKSSGANDNPQYLDVSDVSRPIYDDSNLYTDLWVGYTTRIMNDEVRMKLQLNVVNAFEGGSLRTVAVNYDGSPSSFRIVDPRQFILTATFDF